jgi:hypothetical protein
MNGMLVNYSKDYNVERWRSQTNLTEHSKNDKLTYIASLSRTGRKNTFWDKN